MLLLCIFGTALRSESRLAWLPLADSRPSFFLLSTAQSFEVVLLSRILDGLLGGDVALAQAYLSGVSCFEPEINENAYRPPRRHGHEEPRQNSRDDRSCLWHFVHLRPGPGRLFGRSLQVRPGRQQQRSDARSSLHLPAYLATVLSLLNFLGIYFFLPESLSADKRDHIPFWKCVPIPRIEFGSHVLRIRDISRSSLSTMWPHSQRFCCFCVLASST